MTFTKLLVNQSDAKLKGEITTKKLWKRKNRIITLQRKDNANT